MARVLTLMYCTYYTTTHILLTGKWSKKGRGEREEAIIERKEEEKHHVPFFAIKGIFYDGAIWLKRLEYYSKTPHNGIDGRAQFLPSIFSRKS